MQLSYISAPRLLFCEVKGYGPLQTIVTIAFSLED
jgi:hypothetical protein